MGKNDERPRFFAVLHHSRQDANKISRPNPSPQTRVWGRMPSSLGIAPALPGHEVMTGYTGHGHKPVTSVTSVTSQNADSHHSQSHTVTEVTTRAGVGEGGVSGWGSKSSAGMLRYVARWRSETTLQTNFRLLLNRNVFWHWQWGPAHYSSREN